MENSKDPQSSGRIYGGQTQAERAVKRRRQLLAAGSEVFGELGYRGASVRKVCKAAQLTDRYFYANFDSLEALLIAVYEEAMQSITADVVAAFTLGGDVQAMVKQGLTAFFTRMENPHLVRICLVEIECVGPAVDGIYNGHVRRMAKLLVQLGKAVQPATKFELDFGEAIGVAFIGGVRQLALDQYLNGYLRPREHLVNASLVFCMGILNSV